MAKSKPVPARKTTRAPAAERAPTKLRDARRAPYTTDDPAAALRHFAPLVSVIAPADARPCRADIDIVRHNVATGAAALAPHRTAIERALPAVDVATLLEMPALGLALLLASDRVPGAVPSDGSTAARLASLRPQRDIVLRQAAILAELGLLPRDRVQTIREGNGPIDSARDAVALAALFHEFVDAVRNRHPFTDAQLEQLASDGRWLLTRLVPTGAPADPTAVRSPEALLRDRLWTALERRYATGRLAAIQLWGEKHADEHVPPLQSHAAYAHAGHTPTTTTTPAATPPVTPATT